MNLGFECVEKNAIRIPDRLAVIDGLQGTTYTFAQLNAQVNSMANALLGLGVKKGDRVAIYVGNIPEFIVAFFANCKIGAISVPFNTMLKGMEIEYILNNSGSKILFGMAGETEQNILPILDKIPALEKIISVRGMAGGGSNPDILAFEKLLADNKPEYTALDLAETDGVSLLYTSGTTGKPKGALSTHVVLDLPGGYERRFRSANNR